MWQWAGHNYVVEPTDVVNPKYYGMTNPQGKAQCWQSPTGRTNDIMRFVGSSWIVSVGIGNHCMRPLSSRGRLLAEANERNIVCRMHFNVLLATLCCIWYMVTEQKQQNIKAHTERKRDWLSETRWFAKEPETPTYIAQRVAKMTWHIARRIDGRWRLKVRKRGNKVLDDTPLGGWKTSRELREVAGIGRSVTCLAITMDNNVIRIPMFSCLFWYRTQMILLLSKEIWNKYMTQC